MSSWFRVGLEVVLQWSWGLVVDRQGRAVLSCGGSLKALCGGPSWRPSGSFFDFLFTWMPWPWRPILGKLEVQLGRPSGSKHGSVSLL